MIKNKSNRNAKMLKKSGVSIVAFFTALSATVPAYATIENTAEAVGSYGGNNTTATSNTVEVPVVTDRSLAIVKTVLSGPSATGGSDPAIIDAGDTIIYRYEVTNTGSLTENNIAIADNGPTFNGVAGTPFVPADFTEVTGAGAGTGSAATLGPGQTVVFEATYTLTELDILRAAGVDDGVSNVATAASTAITDPADIATSNTVTTEIPARTGLTIVKTFDLDDTNGSVDDVAEVNEVITYTYTVTNTGNVALTNVRVDDEHQGSTLVFPTAPRNEAITTEGPLQASDLGAVDDGEIAVLEAGAVATFTFVYTVTQADIDG